MTSANALPHPSSYIREQQEKVEKLISMQRQQSLQAQLSAHNAAPGNVARVWSYQSLSEYNYGDSSTRSSSDRGRDSLHSMTDPYSCAPPQTQYWNAQPAENQRDSASAHRTSSCLTGSILWRCTENLRKSICFGAIDGMLTGSGITAACAGLGILTPHAAVSILTSLQSTSFYDLFIKATPPSNLLVLALCIAACSSDAVCIAIGHVWSTRVLLHTHKRRKRHEMQHFYYFHNDSKARLATSLINRGMLKIDAVTIVDVLSGYPDIFVNALVSDSQAIGSSIFGSVNSHSTSVETQQNGAHAPMSNRHTIPNPPFPIEPSQSLFTADIPSTYGSTQESMSLHASHSKPQTPGFFGSDSEPVFINPSLAEPNPGPYYYSDSPLYQVQPPHDDHPLHDNYHFVRNEQETYEDKPVESSMINQAVRESWMEGFCIMSSFTIFSILPCILYVTIHFFSYTANKSSLEYINSYHNNTSYFQDYISPSSMSLVITSTVMVLLGVWKSSFFCTDPLLFGLESLAVFYCSVFFAYSIGYYISSFTIAVDKS